MLFMIKGDGLIRLGALAEADEKKKQQNPNDQSYEERFHSLAPTMCTFDCFSPFVFYNNTFFEMQIFL
jgi:hypothetical protein